MKKHLTSLLILLSIGSFAQVDMSYYLPGGLSYNPNIPTPKEVLGYHPGEWHASHDQLLYYMREVSAASDRMIMQEIGRTYEGRPLVQLTISSPENLANLDQIKADHKKLTDPNSSSSLNTDDMPIVIWLGYSVHGNEASGGNASLLSSYYLAAAIGEEIDELLDNAIIILDPCFNPDGFHRFSSWVNMHRAQTINPDPNDREYREAWPGGRTNHYWFDLNRDWQNFNQPETQSVRKFLNEKKAEGYQFAFGIDFHSTWDDIYYPLDTTVTGGKGKVVFDWIQKISDRLPQKQTNVKPSDKLTPTMVSRTYFFVEHGMPAIVFELGDNTPRDFLKQKGKVAAEELMKLLQNK